MMRIKKFAIAAMFALSTTACATDMGPKQGWGTVLGGVGGAVAGAQFGKGKGQLVGVAAGTLLGAMIGSEIGRSLDRADRMFASQAVEHTIVTGQPAQWQNAETGHFGTVQPMRTYQRPTYDGRTRQYSQEYCREYQTTIVVGGRQESAYGTACQQPNGDWRIVQR